MLPTNIVKWAERYDLSHTIMWEIVETVTTDGDDIAMIRDETHLFDLTVEWACAMIESVYEDPTRTATQSFLLYYLPVVYSLAPYLDTIQRARLRNACGIDTPILTDAMDIVLDITTRRPTPPARHR